MPYRWLSFLKTFQEKLQCEYSNNGAMSNVKPEWAVHMLFFKMAKLEKAPERNWIIPFGRKMTLVEKRSNLSQKKLKTNVILLSVYPPIIQDSRCEILLFSPYKRTIRSSHFHKQQGCCEPVWSFKFSETSVNVGNCYVTASIMGICDKDHL